MAPQAASGGVGGSWLAGCGVLSLLAQLWWLAVLDSQLCGVHVLVRSRKVRTLETTLTPFGVPLKQLLQHEPGTLPVKPVWSSCVRGRRRRRRHHPSTEDRAQKYAGEKKLEIYNNIPNEIDVFWKNHEHQLVSALRSRACTPDCVLAVVFPCMRACVCACVCVPRGAGTGGHGGGVDFVRHNHARGPLRVCLCACARAWVRACGWVGVACLCSACVGVCARLSVCVCVPALGFVDVRVRARVCALPLRPGRGVRDQAGQRRRGGALPRGRSFRHDRG